MELDIEGETDDCIEAIRQALTEYAGKVHAEAERNALDEAGKKFQEILDAEHCPCRKQMALDLQVWRLTLE